MCIYTFLSLDFCTSKIHIIFSPPLHFILFQRFGHTKSSIYSRMKTGGGHMDVVIQCKTIHLPLPWLCHPIVYSVPEPSSLLGKELGPEIFAVIPPAPMHQAKPHWVTVYIHSIHNHFTDSFSINFSLIVFRKVRIFGSSRFQAPICSLMMIAS